MLFLDYNFELVNEDDERWDDLEDGEIINLGNIRRKRYNPCVSCRYTDEGCEIGDW